MKIYNITKEFVMHANDVVIVSALRTAIGSFGGSLSTTSPQEMVSHLIKATINNTNIEASDVNEMILGHVLCAGLGQNPSRQAAIAGGLPIEAPAWQINQVCGSGLRAVALGFQAIQSKECKIMLVGGMESMSMAPHVIKLRDGVKMGSGELMDSMMKDGLVDAFSNQAMGITAENLVEKYSLSREEQDEFALNSQIKARKAIEEGRFKDEIVPLKVLIRRDEKIFSEDEYPRASVSIDDLAKLRPAFKKDGSVTAGNSSGINDGAALLLIMSRQEADKRGLEVLATITSFASAGVDPQLMGIGPVPACNMALSKANWKVSQLDLIEANEAFAAQALAVTKELGLPSDITNVNGGAIALGHPIGASGARVLTTLVHEMKKRNAKKGLTTLCVGGGMGVAMCIERH